MRGRPGVSALMVVRDGARYLEAALESVFAQTVPVDEVVVVDDGSSDATPKLLRSFGSRLKVITQPPSGIGHAANVAVRAASHGLIAFLDSDDLWSPDSIEVRVEQMRRSGRPQDRGGPYPPVRQPGDRLRPPGDLPGGSRAPARRSPRKQPRASRCIHPRRRAGRAAADRTQHRLDVPAMQLSVPIEHIDPVVLHRRIHGANISILLQEQKQVSLLEIVRRHHRRRGLAAGLSEDDSCPLLLDGGAVRTQGLQQIYAGWRSRGARRARSPPPDGP